MFDNTFATIRMRIITVKYVLTEKYVAYMSQNWQQYACVFYRHDVKMKQGYEIGTFYILVTKNKVKLVFNYFIE